MAAGEFFGRQGIYYIQLLPTLTKPFLPVSAIGLEMFLQMGLS